MTTEVWLRKPNFFIRDALANGYSRFVFDREYAGYYKIDVVSYMREMCIGVNPGVEYLLIGPQGAALYDILSVHQRPKAVYPVWSAARPVQELMDLMAEPVGEKDPAEFVNLPDGLRPTFGQEHRVVIRDLPSASNNMSRKISRDILLAAEMFPGCKLHLSGVNNFSLLFDYNYQAVDFDPVGASVQDLTVILPNGISLRTSERPEWAAYEPWINLLGFQLRQIAINKRVLVAFNIKSVHWAAEYYNQDLKIKMRYKPSDTEIIVPRNQYVPKTDYLAIPARPLTTAMRSLLINNRNKETDFFLCSGCIYRTTCKFARADSVCIYKGAETVALADAFGSRSADRIIDGLSELLKLQSNRTERAIEDEEDNDPDVTRQINALFKNGVLLAKLLDPSLNGKGTTVNVGVAVNGNTGQVAAADPRQMVAAAVRALENQGIPRDEITHDMIKLLLQNPGVPVAQAKPVPAIEGVVMRTDDES